MLTILLIESKGKTGKARQRLILNPPEGRLAETLIPANETVVHAHEALLEGSFEVGLDQVVFIKEEKIGG